MSENEEIKSQTEQPIEQSSISYDYKAEYDRLIKLYDPSKKLPKIKFLKLDKLIFDLAIKHNNVAAKVHRELAEMGITIEYSHIVHFIRKITGTKLQEKKFKMEVDRVSEYNKLSMDYSKELKSILDEVRQIKEKVIKESDYNAYNQLIGRLMQGIELLAKINGDIKLKPTLDINILYEKVSNDVERRMTKLHNDIYKGKIQVIDVDYEIDQDNRNARQTAKNVEVVPAEQEASSDIDDSKEIEVDSDLTVPAMDEND